MKKILLSVVFLLVAIQFISPAKTNPKVDDSLALHTDSKVQSVLKRSCYDCHSFETKWTTLADVAPFSWVIVSHVDDGRNAMNFSKWSEIDSNTKTKRLKRIIQTTSNGMMPLPNYLTLHEEAKLSSDDKKILREWADSQLKNIKQD